MGFIGKLGNFAEDIGSFALPAGLMLGGTVLTGGNPMGGMALLSALGAGSKGLAANEEEERLRKLQKRQREAQAIASLRNAANRGGNAQPWDVQTPKSGILETLGRATGTGIDAFAMAQQVAQASKLRDLQMQREQAQIGALPQEAKLRDLQMQREQAQIGALPQEAKLRDLQMQSAQQGLDVGQQAMQRQTGRDLANQFGSAMPQRQEELNDPAAMAGYAEQRGANQAATAKARALATQQQFENQLDQAKLAATQDTTRATRDAADTAAAETFKQRSLASEDKLRDDFTRLTNSTRIVQEGWQKIVAASANPSPFGDVALLYGTMKINDPTSTVREGEYATAENTGSIPTRIRQMYNKALDGERLTDPQRADMVSTAKNLYEAQLGVHQKTKNDFIKIAELRGLDPRSILVGGPLELPGPEKSVPVPTLEGVDEALSKYQQGIFGRIGAHRQPMIFQP